jgi:hypothetical protein
MTIELSDEEATVLQAKAAGGRFVTWEMDTETR